MFVHGFGAQVGRVSRILALLPVGVTHPAKGSKQRATLAGLQSEANQDPAIGRTVIAVVEQGNIKIITQGAEEVEQSARALGKLHAENKFAVQRRGTLSADHVPDMELGRLVVG